MVVADDYFRNRPEAAGLIAAWGARGDEVGPVTGHACAAVQAWARAVESAGTTGGTKGAAALRRHTFDGRADRVR